MPRFLLRCHNKLNRSALNHSTAPHPLLLLHNPVLSLSQLLESHEELKISCLFFTKCADSDITGVRFCCSHVLLVWQVWEPTAVGNFVGQDTVNILSKRTSFKDFGGIYVGCLMLFSVNEVCGREIHRSSWCFCPDTDLVDSDPWKTKRKCRWSNLSLYMYLFHEPPGFEATVAFSVRRC